MVKTLKLFAVMLVFLLSVPVQAQQRAVVQGEDEQEFKRTLRTDTEGRPQAVQAQKLLDSCDSTDGWSALNSDTEGLSTDLDHTQGSNSLEFDKVDSVANTVFGAIQKTLTAVDVASYMENNGFIMLSLNVSATTDIDYCLVRLGTDASNYNEWRVDADALSTGWQQIRFFFYAPSTAGNLGNGMNAAAITYVVLGCAFSSESATLADLRVDNLAINTGFQTSTDLSSQVSSTAATQNVNVVKIASQPVDMGAGVVGPGTQRITQATDDVVSVSDDDNPNSPTNPMYTQPTDGTNLAYIAPATADGLSKSENGIKTESVVYLDNGASADPAKSGANKELTVTDIAVRPGENPGKNSLDVEIAYLGTSEPSKVGPTAVDDTALSVTTGTVIFGPTKALGNGKLCVYVKNTGGGSGNALSDVEIYDSPDGTSGWDDTNTWTSCDGLAASTKICKYCTNDAIGWFQVKGRCASGEDTTAEVWSKQVKR